MRFTIALACALPVLAGCQSIFVAPSMPAPNASATPGPGSTPSPAPTPAPPVPVSDAALCSGWTSRTIASGLGVLESVLPDPNGNGTLLSNTTSNLVQRIDAHGTVTTVASVSAPGGMVRAGNLVLLPTGDAALDGIADTPNGTLIALDPTTGSTTTLTTGLVMPNGLALDAAGNAYTTNDLTIPGPGVVRIPFNDQAHPQTNWTAVSDSNGIAVDDARRLVYVDQTFTPNSDIDVVSLDDPSTVTQLVSLAGVGSVVPKGLDDLILDSAGIIDVAANGSGEIIRVDPQTKFACVLASGYLTPSAVAQETSSPRGLLAVGFDGTLHELVPPSPLP